MRFLILGPLQIVGEDGRLVAIGPRPARLLAALLLSADRMVTLPELVDAVWDEDPPATARQQIQSCVWMLRKKSVGVRAHGHGYGIAVQAGQLDADVFEESMAQAQSLADTGDVRQARETLWQALSLWRGPALAGLAGRRIQTGAARLDELRLVAGEQRFNLDLSLGRHQHLVAELTELVATHPLREQLAALLMRALCGSGRRAEALAVFQRVRVRFAQELGIDPSPDLQRLQVSILRGNEEEKPQIPTLVKASPAIPRQLPASVRHFVGRDAELKELDNLIDRSPASAVAICTITGGGGMGKTTLAVHWAHQVADSFPDGQIYLNLRGFDPTAAPSASAEAMRTLLDALHCPAERVPLGLDAQAALYRSLLAARRVLLILDNAHDADQVRPLLPGTPGCAVLITSRDRLGGLTVSHGAQPIRLDVLTAGECHELLLRHLGSDRVAAEPAAAGQIIERCARLPLALTITAVQAAAQPASKLSAFAADLADAEHRLDLLTVGEENTRVRAVLSWSYRHLGPEPGRLFRLVALHPGPHFSLAAAAGIADRPIAETRSLVGDLLQAHLLNEHSPGQFSFHDLLRAYATELVHREESDHDRRAAVHRMLDHYLHTAHKADRTLYPAQDGWTITAPRSGSCPQDIPDLAAALDWFNGQYPVLLAVARQSACGWDRHTWQLACALTNFLYRQANWEDMLGLHRAALTAARRIDDTEAQILTSNHLSYAHLQLGDYDEARKHLDHALGLAVHVGDRTRQAATEHRLAFLAEREGQHELALTHARNSLALYQAIDHPSGEAVAHNAVGWFHAHLGDHQEAIRHCRRALTLQVKLENKTGQAHAWDSLGYGYHRQGDYGEAVTCYQNSLGLFRELGNRNSEADTLTHLGDTHQARGNPSAARDCWLGAAAILDELNHPAADRVRAKLHGESR